MDWFIFDFMVIDRYTVLTIVMVLSVTKHMVSATSPQLAVAAADEAASEDASRPLAYLIPPREAFNIVLYECHINYHLFPLPIIAHHICNHTSCHFHR